MPLDIQYTACQVWTGAFWKTEEQYVKYFFYISTSLTASYIATSYCHNIVIKLLVVKVLHSDNLSNTNTSSFHRKLETKAAIPHAGGKRQSGLTWPLWMSGCLMLGVTAPPLPIACQLRSFRWWNRIASKTRPATGREVRAAMKDYPPARSWVTGSSIPAEMQGGWGGKNTHTQKDIFLMHRKDTSGLPRGCPANSPHAKQLCTGGTWVRKLCGSGWKRVDGSGICC